MVSELIMNISIEKGSYSYKISSEKREEDVQLDG